MTPGGRLQIGDLVAIGNDRAVVLNVGRSQCYSVQVIRQRDERVVLYTEVPFHMERGAVVFIKRNPVNVGWARAWRYSNPDALLDL